MHKQDERLTNKHIQTLSFLQEMANENKLLKQRIEEMEKEQEKCQELHALAEESQARIKDIQEKYLQRSDEINQMLAEQHRIEMMQVLDDKSEMERSLKEEMLKLRHEIESLKRTNVELRDESEWAEEKKSLQKNIADLEEKLQTAHDEVEELTASRDKLQQSLESSQHNQASDIHQLQELRQTNHELTEQLQQASQNHAELAFRFSKLEQELNENAGEKEQLQLIENLRHKMQKLLKEKELVVMQQEATQKECDEAKALIVTLQATIKRLEQEKEKVVTEYGELTLEFEKLRRKLIQDQDRAGFRDFVAVKRELIAVKNENEVLKLKAKSSSVLPMLKEDLPPPKPPAVMTKKGRKKLLAITLTHGTGNSQTD